MATINKPMLRVCRTDNCSVMFPEDLATVWITGALRYIEVSMWNFFLLWNMPCMQEYCISAYL